jgi:hypothetical protein
MSQNWDSLQRKAKVLEARLEVRFLFGFAVFRNDSQCCNCAEDVSLSVAS